MGGPHPLSYLESLELKIAGAPLGTGLPGLGGLDSLLEGAPNKIAQLSDVLGGMKRFDAWGPYLDVVGTGATAIDQYNKSTAQTEAGKFIDGVLAGGMDYAVGKSNPVFAALDSGVGAFFEMLGVEGMSMGDTTNTGIRATVTLVEGVITWDEKGMEDFHTRSMNGDYGMIFQGWSMIGDALSPYTSEVVEFVAEDLFAPIDWEAMREQARAEQVAEAPDLVLPSSSEEVGTRSSSVAYETVPPPRPPDPDECEPRRRR